MDTKPSTVLQAQSRFYSGLPNRSMALVLAGGRGSRLHGLTDWRAKPAVPFGGKYRLIDFALSNCLNSGIPRVGVLTQYMSHSLNQHVQQGWNLSAPDGSPMVELLPAQQRTAEHAWYQGTADAVYQNLDIIRAHNPELVLVLAGDHIYKMDYRPLLEHHMSSGADMTVAAIETDRCSASHFGVLNVDSSMRVNAFVEKPENPPCLPNDPDRSLVSMGIYVFSSDFLYEQLAADHLAPQSEHDFGKNLIPELLHQYHISAYHFRSEDSAAPAYWRDVGTIDAFWSANLELIGVLPQLNLYDEHWPIRTFQSQSPPAKFIFDSEERCGSAVNSMICDGCIISGARISNSLLFTNVVANEQSTIDESVVLPDVRIGERCRLRRVIVDRHCEIPSGLSLGYDADFDSRFFAVSEQGVVLVTKPMLEDLQNTLEEHDSAAA